MLQLNALWPENPYFKPFSRHKAKTPTLKKLYQSWSTYLAVGLGFEPRVPFPTHLYSKQAHSTALASHQTVFGILYLVFILDSFYSHKLHFFAARNASENHDNLIAARQFTFGFSVVNHFINRL